MMGLKQEIKRRQSVAAGALLPGLPQRFEGVMPQLGPAQAQAAPSSNQSQSDNSQVREMIDVACCLQQWKPLCCTVRGAENIII